MAVWLDYRLAKMGDCGALILLIKFILELEFMEVGSLFPGRLWISVPMKTEKFGELIVIKMCLFDTKYQVDGQKFLPGRFQNVMNQTFNG